MSRPNVLTLPVDGRLYAVRVIPISYANRDTAKPAGGFFVDDDGNIAVAINTRAPAPLVEAALTQAVQDAVRALRSPPN